MEAAASAPVVYGESLESSPRSRNTDAWDSPTSSSAGSGKLRLMCSYGGRIVPRPRDKSLCYLGGTTRIVVFDRSSSLAALSAKLSSSLLDGRPFSLKYQLPNEDLDSLISVSTDEDLENMIEEYDRILASSSSSSAAAAAAASSSRLRLFLFPPSKPESVSAIGSLVEDSKSEAWFVDTLNGAGILPRAPSADSSADINCLLGLDEGTAGGSASSKQSLVPDSPPSGGKAGKIDQEMNSVPGSPMMETTSSFGSTSSAPCLSNLPPIRVRVDEGGVRSRGPRMELEEHFSHMNVSGGTAPPPATISSQTERPTRISSDDERSEQGTLRKPSQPPTLPQQKASAPDFANNSVSRDGSDNSGSIPRNKAGYYAEPVIPIRPPIERSSPRAAVASLSDPKRDIKDPTYPIPVQVQDPGFVLPIQQREQQQQQQPFFHHPAHYIHQRATTPVPVSPYYQIHPQQQQPPGQRIDPQYQMYFVPVGHNQTYGLPIPSNLPDPPANPSNNPAPIVNNTPGYLLPQRPPSELSSNLYRTATAQPPAAAAPLMQLGDQPQQQQYMGYRLHHPTQQSATAAASGSYTYEFTDPLQAQLYYAQQTATNLASQYQAASSGGMMSEFPLPPHSMSNSKQNRAS